MSDKSTDNEQFDDNLVDDFDFGDNETANIPMAATSKSNKKSLFVIVFLGILAGVIFMGYKHFGNKTATTVLASNSTLEKPLVPTPAEKLALKSMPSDPTPDLKPAPTAPKALVPPSEAPKPNATPAQPIAPAEHSFNEIAQAFSSADKTNTPPESPVPLTPPSTAPSTQEATKTIVKEGSIQDLQKELFTPEKEPTPTAKEEISSTQVVALTQGLNKLNQQIEYILGQIKYLDTYSREVSDNLNKLNESISAMDNRLIALTNTTSSLSKDVGTVRNEVGHFKQVLKDDGLDLMPAPVPVSAKKKTETHEGKGTVEEPEFTVHAVIPGRAWLKSTKGQILTVAEGDAVGNYGKILVIDAANGVVLTSSGVTFR